MSNHKTPLTVLEHDGLVAHGLGRYIGVPSQAADIFRQGVNWAMASPEWRAEALRQRREVDAMLAAAPEKGQP